MVVAVLAERIEPVEEGKAESMGTCSIAAVEPEETSRSKIDRLKTHCLRENNRNQMTRESPGCLMNQATKTKLSRLSCLEFSGSKSW